MIRGGVLDPWESPAHGGLGWAGGDLEGASQVDVRDLGWGSLLTLLSKQNKIKDCSKFETLLYLNLGRECGLQPQIWGICSSLRPPSCALFSLCFL